MWKELDMEIDPAFLERDALRKAGKPVQIVGTERLLIRETILGDVPALYEIYEQPGIKGRVRPLQPTLREEMEFMEAYIQNAYSFYDYGLWTVLERNSGSVIGRAGLFPSEEVEHGVELGYLLAPRWQRQGLGKECGQAILRYAKDVLDMEELCLLADRENIASIKTAEALGFCRTDFVDRAGRELVLYKKKL